MNKITIYAIIIFIIICLGFSIPRYKIYPSSKVNCDILLNTQTGQTWFNCNGYWEKVSKNLTK